MNALNVAVVGVGSFGRHHVRHLSRHARVGSVTVVDRNGERARACAATHGARVAEDVASVSPDAAVITVETEAHRAVAESLIARGVHVFVEKPIAASDIDAFALVAAAERAGVVLQVGHVERFAPAFVAIAERAQGIRSIKAVRHNPPRPTPPTADVVVDLMIHDIDLALALAAAPVTAVTAGTTDGGEAATARLDFANGVVARLSASRRAVATERALTIEDAGGAWHADLLTGRLTRTTPGGTEDHLLPSRDNLAAELDEFVCAALGEARPTVDGRAGAAALAVATRVRAALSMYPLSA
ncbi:Gfo/Idh/MocA family protein [Acuticoccus sp.]|uniref:Gfo/Idh/MocA family protein n=1 Tax=Acuticoccus sp. TaxID=1904378 RepID=UPI003B51AA46